jgi:branched-chain amino acid transport system substrate-binding protein
VPPADFTTFWNQAGEHGFRPKAASIGKAILFPEVVQALGKKANNLSEEVWWSPNHPFKSSLGNLCEASRPRLSAGNRPTMDPADWIYLHAVGSGG